MGFVIGNGITIVPEEIPVDEIECCLSCVAYATSRGPGWNNLLFMQWRHADHTVNPDVYEGELNGITKGLRNSTSS